ncbi:exonuclease domain-containing protein [Facklamia sp. 7083-14-GEN3]|uniref:exonuclease domain-containing protein n=1 Tax=Facklamia sp. 7083-14-GEN3 TaxID=2973478 RepID=UPI00215BF88D|nr:exonuclease domain-containing protein [Facklamia sp. 7083-14-GEN3]MCR8968962.1 exonuclease domain-containing protein [Facklamia sp. 7083-14-GEN3]
MKYAIVDLESTGPRLDSGDRIIQIGAVIIDQGQVIGQYEMLINPEREVPQNIQQLTGISQKEVDQAPRFESVANLWFKRLEDCLFIAHNLNHDLTFMQHHFQACGLDFNPLAIDSVKLAKIIFPQALGFNLTDLSLYLDIPFTQAHQALADAQITAKILNAMASKWMQLPDQTQTLLLDLAQALDKQEIIFFQQPKQFILNQESDAELDEKPTLDQGDLLKPKAKAQVNWLLEKTQTTNRLVVEGQWRPIDPLVIKHWLLAVLREEKASLVLAVSSQSALEEWATFLKREDITFSFLLRPSQYLHLDHFKCYLDQVVISQLNQQEILVIASTLVWLEETKTGLLMEMNHELKIKDQIKRFNQGLYPNYKASFFYQKALSNHQNQAVVLTQTGYLMEEASQEARFNKHEILVCDNLSLLTRQLSFFHQIQLAYSQLLIICQQVLDILYHQDRTHPSIQASILRMDHLINLIRQVLNLLESEVQDRHFQVVDRELIREVKVSLTTTQAILSIQQQMHKALKNLLQEQALKDLSVNNPHHLKVKTVHLQAFLNKLDNFQAKMGQSEGYLTIRVSQIEDRYYQFQLTWKPIRLVQEYQQAFESFKQVLLFSPGDLHFRLNSGSYYQLGLDQYTYLQLPQQSEKLAIQVPFDWIAKDSQNQQRDIEQGRLIGENVLESIQAEDLPPLSLIIVNNRQQAIDVYRQIKGKLKKQEQVRLLGQHVSGSLNKIRRLAMDDCDTILVIQWQSLLNENWTLDKRPCQIFWLRLPFRSLEDAYILALSGHLNIPFDLIFDHLLIDRMLVDFSIAFDYLDRHFNCQNFCLLDDRVFTKYYSKEIRQKLEHLVEFNLQ